MKTFFPDWQQRRRRRVLDSKDKNKTDFDESVSVRGVKDKQRCEKEWHKKKECDPQKKLPNVYKSCLKWFH